MLFLITNLVLLGIIIFLFLVLSAVWPPDSPWAPWWQMPDAVCLESARLTKLTNKDIVYDLGCGTGKALITANTKFGAKGVGVEIDPLRVWFAKRNVKKYQARGVEIVKKNFFSVDIHPATVVYMYLVPNALRRLTNKLMEELQPGTKLVSYVYDFPETYKGKIKLLSHDKKNMLYVYMLRKTK